jgi:hypothetical protein
MFWRERKRERRGHCREKSNTFYVKDIFSASVTVFKIPE